MNLQISKALLYTEDGIEYTRTEVSHRSVIWDRGATMPRKNALEEDIFRNSRIPRIANEIRLALTSHRFMDLRINQSFENWNI